MSLSNHQIIGISILGIALYVCYASSKNIPPESNLGSPVGANIGLSTKNLSEVSKEWAEEVARTDPNFLYPQHVAGAVGCDGNKCVFLALNYSGYGKGCVLKKK